MSLYGINVRKVLGLFERIGPGHPPSYYEAKLGLDREALRAAVCVLNGAGLLDTDVEMGSTWIGHIE